jgi:4-aminobutyrate aminotransferase-like enzyme
MDEYTYLTRNVRPSQAQFVNGAGLEVRDSRGRTLLDLGSQTANLSLGQCHPEVTAAVARQVRELIFASWSFSSEPFLDLSARLVELAPKGLVAANLRMCNGSDAVETACKIARLYKWSRKILAVRGAWHGQSTATLAFSPGHAGSLLTSSADVDVVLSAEPTLESLVHLIESTADAAGVIVDPVGVSNGLFPLEEVTRHLPRIRQLCSERDIVLIFDEVQTFGGFMGRTLFAAQAFDVTPDVICVAKAIGGGLPLAGVLCRRDLADLLSHDEGEYTNGGNPVSCAAGLAFLTVYVREHDVFQRNADAFQRAVEAIAAACPDLELRVHGFIATFQRREDRFREVWAGRAVAIALEQGIILRVTNLGQSVLLKPALLIDPGTSRGMATRLIEVFKRAADETAHPGVSIEDLRAAVYSRKSGAVVPDFRALLEAVDPACEVRDRSGNEVEQLTRQLPFIGIRVSRAFVSGMDDCEYEQTPGTALNSYLASDGSQESTVNGLLTQHQRWLEVAHTTGLILGNRWSGTAVVRPGGSLRLIDFGLAYSGPFETLAAFEELFALVDIGIHIPSAVIRRKVLGRFGNAIFRRWTQDAVKSWNGIRRNLVDGARSGSATVKGTVYEDLIRCVDSFAPPA